MLKNLRNATSDRGEVLVYGGRGRDYIQYNQKLEKHIFVTKKKLKLNIKRKTLITSELDSYKTNTCTYIIAKKQDFPKDIFKTNLLAFSVSTIYRRRDSI